MFVNIVERNFGKLLQLLKIQVFLFVYSDKLPVLVRDELPCKNTNVCTIDDFAFKQGKLAEKKQKFGIRFVNFSSKESITLHVRKD